MTRQVIFRILAAFVFTVSVASCGKPQEVDPTVRANPFAQTIKTDASMRGVLNQKWTCTHANDAASGALPYRKISILNRGATQSLQLAVHYLANQVPTADILQVENLQCYYSSSDTRIIKCYSQSDSSLQIQTATTGIYDLQFDILSLNLLGKESSYTIYFGGPDNRLATLDEFKKRYHEPFQMRVNSPDQCGFEN